MPKAHMVTTVYCSNGAGRKFMKKYIVITGTTSRAIDLIHLEDGEEVLQGKELTEYQVILEDEHGSPESH